MCGFIFFHNKSNEVENIKEYFHDIKYRGPDKTNTRTIYNNFFGFHRLSIIDLDDRSMQPFEDDNYIILFNGEIYNYINLRKELTSFSYNFKTQSDTEVLIKLYDKYGKAMHKKIEGMYAAIIYSKKDNKITMFRDNFGIKPLYYFKDKDKFVACSSIKAIKKIISKDEINKNNMINFLRFGFTFGPETIYSKIFEVENGYEYSLDLNTFSLEKNIFFNYQDLNNKNSEAESLNLILNYTIKSHLTSDVKVTTLKSNGLDSNLIYNYSRKYVENDYFYYDYNDNLIQHNNNKKLNKFQIGNKYEELFEKYINFQEYPTIDGFNTYLLTHYVNRLGYKVCLSGLGLDEVLDGYGLLKKINFLQFTNKFLPKLKLSTNLNIKIRKLFSSKHNFDFLDFYLLIRSVNLESNLSKFFDKKEIDFHYNQLKASLFKVVSNHNTEFKDNQNTLLSLLEMNFYLKNQLLKDSDHFSMLNSVELRVPYIEKNFIKSLFSLNKTSNLDKRNFFKKNLKSELSLINLETEKKGFITNNYKILNKIYNIKNPSNLIYYIGKRFGL